MSAAIPNLLHDNLDHPQWDVVADVCLSCGNCTLACPTCFCSDAKDVNNLSGDHTERWTCWWAVRGTSILRSGTMLYTEGDPPTGALVPSPGNNRTRRPAASATA